MTKVDHIKVRGALADTLTLPPKVISAALKCLQRNNATDLAEVLGMGARECST